MAENTVVPLGTCPVCKQPHDITDHNCIRELKAVIDRYDAANHSLQYQRDRLVTGLEVVTKQSDIILARATADFTLQTYTNEDGWESADD